MNTEIEAKFLGVDTLQLRTKLQEVGATLEYAEILMKRKTFDSADGSMRARGGWVRVRDEGEKITLSYKQLNDRTLHGTKEVSVVVDDFEKTCDLLSAIGLVVKSYQETKREKWIYRGSEITIDTWPWIKTFVEIESSSEERIKDLANLLGFDWKDALHGSVENAYQEEYDVTEEEVDSWPKITFEPVPLWLESKRK